MEIEVLIFYIVYQYRLIMEIEVFIFRLPVQSSHAHLKLISNTLQ